MARQYKLPCFKGLLRVAETVRSSFVYKNKLPPGAIFGLIELMNKDKRIGWDEYFIEIAKMVAKRSTCNRRFVGAVIVRDRNILSTGYNGSPKGLPHCDEIDHEISDGHCIRTIHAEANALVQAAKHGVSVNSASLYLTYSPCYDCFKMIVNAGIKEIIYGEFYNSRYGASPKVLKLAKKTGIKMRMI